MTSNQTLFQCEIVLYIYDCMCLGSQIINKIAQEEIAVIAYCIYYLGHHSRHIYPSINSTQLGYLWNQSSILHADKYLFTSLGKFTLSRIRGPESSQINEMKVFIHNGERSANESRNTHFSHHQRTKTSECGQPYEASGARFNTGLKLGK